MRITLMIFPVTAEQDPQEYKEETEYDPLPLML